MSTARTSKRREGARTVFGNIDPAIKCAGVAAALAMVAGGSRGSAGGESVVGVVAEQGGVGRGAGALRLPALPANRSFLVTLDLRKGKAPSTLFTVRSAVCSLQFAAHSPSLPRGAGWDSRKVLVKAPEQERPGLGCLGSPARQGRHLLCGLYRLSCSRFCADVSTVSLVVWGCLRRPGTW